MADGADSKARWLREPLLHFVVLGALLFGVSRWWDARSPTDDKTIVVSAAQREQLAMDFEALAGREPRDDELQRLVDAWVDREILYREAVRMGLDRGDPKVKQRVVQKMEFVVGEELGLDEPDEATLQAFLDENEERYAGVLRYDFTLLSFGGEHAERLATQARASLASGADIGDVGAKIARSRRHTPANAEKTYGRVIAEALVAATPKTWVDVPLRGGHGLLRVDGVERDEVPPLDKVRATVARDWAEAKRRDAVRQRIESLREEYRVEVDP